MVDKMKFFPIILGLIVFACGSNEEPEPAPDEETETAVMQELPKEFIVPSSAIKKIIYRSEYEALFGVGTTDYLVFVFDYKGTEYVTSATTLSPYDSADLVNVTTKIDRHDILDETKPAKLDSLMTEFGLWGVILKEHNAFEVTVERLSETKRSLPGTWQKIVFEVGPDVPLNVVRNGCCGDRKFYASSALENPEFYPIILNEALESFSKKPRHSAFSKF